MERRVLILAPRGRDAQVVGDVLESRGIRSHPCATVPEVLAELARSAAAVVLTEEALADAPADAFTAFVDGQPSWSDLPFIVLATRQERRRSPRALLALRSLGNVVVLERPVDAETLGSAAASAVRARARQYATRSHLEQLGDTRAVVERLNRELEDRIAQRTRELASANDRLMAEIAERERAQATLVQLQKMEAIGQLTGGIAHDFNNLLHVVSMNIDMVARLSTEPRIVSLASQAKRAVGRGAKLTGQLLSFARNQSLLPRLNHVGELLGGMRELVEVSTGAGIAVEWRLAEDPAMLAVLDASQLEMAVLNLAVNARDAMPEGGRLAIAADRRGTGDTGLPAGDYVVVSVADSGAGIPANLLQKVFDPFFTTKPVGSGTGLGLSQVHGFAEQSGGRAFIHSAPGEGTRVEMYFPAAQAPARPSPDDAPARPADGRPTQRRRILVVEDDADVRRVIVESLGLLGHDVEEAADGADGLAAIARRPPDLLIVDYAMPGMNGAEVVARARAMVGGLPVVLATGYADMAEVGRVLGTHSILTKPFDIATLSGAVGQALRGEASASGRGRKAAPGG
jgi:signal transduction histidine kinase/ActR/RegA family two-component response regulator